MKSRLELKSVLVMLGLVASFASVAKDTPPEVTEQGLQLMKDSNMALVYAAPGADLSGYHRIWLVEPYVAFKKNWQRDQNRSKGIKVTNSDMDRIRNRLAEEFTVVFAEVLQENDGYELVEERGDDVLILRPAIINLDVNAPDTRNTGRSRTYASYAGEMTLYLEAFDSQTNALIAKSLDRGHDRDTGFMTWQSSVSNTQAAKRILRGWAQSLRAGLDEAHTATAGNSPD